VSVLVEAPQHVGISVAAQIGQIVPGYGGRPDVALQFDHRLLGHAGQQRTHFIDMDVVRNAGAGLRLRTQAHRHADDLPLRVQQRTARIAGAGFGRRLDQERATADPRLIGLGDLFFESTPVDVCLCAGRMDALHLVPSAHQLRQARRERADRGDVPRLHGPEQTQCGISNQCDVRSCPRRLGIASWDEFQ
jgi:hypothetical protein